MKLIWDLFGPKEKINTWITIAVWVGILSLFAFTAVYKVICYDEIENDYRTLHNLAMVIELPEGSHNVKYERSPKFLYSMLYIKFETDEPAEKIIESVSSSLLPMGFKKKNESGYLAKFLKEDYKISLYYVASKGQYYISIHQNNWKWRLGM